MSEQTHTTWFCRPCGTQSCRLVDLTCGRCEKAIFVAFHGTGGTTYQHHDPDPSHEARPASLCSRCGRTFDAGKHWMIDGINYHEFESDLA